MSLKVFKKAEADVTRFDWFNAVRIYSTQTNQGHIMGVASYLMECANNDQLMAFPTQQSIKDNCGLKSKQAVSNAIGKARQLRIITQKRIGALTSDEMKIMTTRRHAGGCVYFLSRRWAAVLFKVYEFWLENDKRGERGGTEKFDSGWWDFALDAVWKDHNLFAANRENQ